MKFIFPRGVIIYPLNFHQAWRFYLWQTTLATAVSLTELFCLIALWWPVGSTVTPHNSSMRPPGSIMDHCRLQLTSAAIVEAKTKACQKSRLYLKLDDRMRDRVHIYIHSASIPRAIKKLCTHHPLLPSLKLVCLTKLNLSKTIYPMQRTCLWWKFFLMMNTCYTVPQHHQLQINTSLAVDCSLPLVDLCTCLQCLHSDIGGHQCFTKDFLLGRGELSQDSTPKHVEQTLCEEGLL